MSSVGDNKSKSKKKKKFTALQLRHVNASRKKFGVLGSPESSALPSTASAHAQFSSSSPPPTKLPPNFNHLLPKRKKFDAVSDSNIIMGIRFLPTTT